jgi:hypothetical protein
MLRNMGQNNTKIKCHLLFINIPQHVSLLAADKGMYVLTCDPCFPSC